MANSGIGTSPPRKEDEALLTGRGRFIDDINLDGQLHAAFLRSTHAHARLLKIDVEAARRCGGVVAVFTGKDICRPGFAHLEQDCSVSSSDGRPACIPPWRAMSPDIVRYVGDTVAMVIANTTQIAHGALDLISVDYEPLPHTTDLRLACAANAPRIWPQFESNVSIDWQRGDAQAVDDIFSRATHVVETTIVQNRIVVAALETRGAIAEYDETSNRLTLYTPTQGGTPVHRGLAKAMLLAEEQIRVVSPDVGGAFGIKANLYPEQVLVTWAAMHLRKPIKWYGDRSDSFLSDFQARDHVMHGSLALSEDGEFLAIRCDTISNMGAYLFGPGPIIPTAGGTRCLTNVYRTPVIHARSRCVFTNTVPIGAYRGAGKPEFCHLVERLVDEAATQLGQDPVELRRRNLVRPEHMPYDTPTGLRYDSGDFEAVMDESMAHAQRTSFETRRGRLKEQGLLLGLGFSLYTEPDGFKDNRVTMSFDERGALKVTTTAHNNGQGYETVFSQVANSLLGIAYEAIHIVQGDTEQVGHGSGAGGSRVTTVTGAGMHRCAELIKSQAIALAAQLLQKSVSELTFDTDNARVIHANGEMSMMELAIASWKSDRLPESVQRGLFSECHYDAPTYSFPCGAHVCEVEIDGLTGSLKVTRYFHVSDFGTVVNPTLLAGQLHGGIAQGLGQAILEDSLYDNESGQYVTGSFMDYCLPRATHVPNMDWYAQTTICQTNPLGVKGCGESGATASVPAIINATVDALRDYDTRNLQMPVTAERIWRIIRQGAVR